MDLERLYNVNSLDECEDLLDRAIRAGDRTLEITLEITNLTVFPDLRDQSGSPCVTVSWVAFQSAK